MVTPPRRHRPTFVSPPDRRAPERSAPVHRDPPAPPLADRPRRRSGARVRGGGRRTVPVLGPTGDRSSWRPRALAAGTVLTPGDLGTASIPASSHITAMSAVGSSALVGQQLDTPVYAGQVMVKPDAVEHAPAGRR